MSRSAARASAGTRTNSTAAPSTLHAWATASTASVDTDIEARPPAKSPDPNAAAISTPTATAVIGGPTDGPGGGSWPSREQRPLQQLAGGEARQLVDEAYLGRALEVG